MNLRNFWYVLAHSEDLRPQTVLSRRLLGEWLVVFRGVDGRAAVLQDRCCHRNGRLSDGSVEDGCVRCPYHGWAYDGGGQVVDVPAEGPRFRPRKQRRTTAFETREQDGYVYVRLEAPDTGDIEPYPMPEFGRRGWTTVRLVNEFCGSLADCAENFIDIPHTVSVHPSIFRVAKGQRLNARIERVGGSIHVDYTGESDNLGWFRRFLNPGGRPIVHRDSFHMPNVTSVLYDMGPHRKFWITSQSVPTDEQTTTVFTDLTYDYGVWSTLAAPIVRWQAQKIIDQDIEILRRQAEVIEKYGSQFQDMESDRVHAYVRSVLAELQAGRDPRHLPHRLDEVTFWV